MIFTAAYNQVVEFLIGGSTFVKCDIEIRSFSWKWDIEIRSFSWEIVAEVLEVPLSMSGIGCFEWNIARIDWTATGSRGV